MGSHFLPSSLFSPVGCSDGLGFGSQTSQPAWPADKGLSELELDVSGEPASFHCSRAVCHVQKHVDFQKGFMPHGSGSTGRAVITWPLAMLACISPHSWTWVNRGLDHLIPVCINKTSLSSPSCYVISCQDQSQIFSNAVLWPSSSCKLTPHPYPNSLTSAAIWGSMPTLFVRLGARTKLNY